MQSRYKSTRSVIALLLVAVMIIGFSATLYKIQVRDHEYYAAQNNTVKTYKVAIEAARGEIVDRNGNALVTNRETNSIILDAAYFPAATENDKRNAILQNLIALFQKNGEEYTQNLHQTEKALIALENTIWSNNALKTQYAIELLNQMKIGLFSVRNAFDTLFKAFEEKGRIPVSDLTSLLKQIEHMNLSFEQIEEAIEEQVTGDPAFLESVAEANPETGSTFILTYHFAALESDIFQFIENVYRLQLPTETSTLTVTTEGLLEEQEEIESLTAQMQAFFERAQIDEIEALREIFDPMTTLFQTTSELVERGHAISEMIMNAEVPAKEDTLAFKTLVDIYTRLIDTITTRLMEQLEAHR